eukprot:scaffold128_cov248-Pinguiococcus_pyrenoidosus.AAC.48
MDLVAVRAARPHAVVHEGRAVHGPLVVLPQGHALVQSVPTDVVDHVLRAVQVLLHQDAFVDLAQAVDFPVHRHEGLLHLLDVLAKEDVVRPGALDRLHDDLERARIPVPDERGDGSPLRGAKLLHRADAAVPHLLPHEVLVAAVQAELHAVVASAQLHRETVREEHPGLGARHDGDDGLLHVPKRLDRIHDHDDALLPRVLLAHEREVEEAPTGQLQRAQHLVVLRDHFRVRVQQLRRSRAREAVDRLRDEVPRLDHHLEAVEARAVLDNLHAGHGPDHARLLHHEEDLAAVRTQLGGPWRVRIERFRREEARHRAVHLRVSVARLGDGAPGPLAAMAARPDLDEARSVVHDHDFHVARAVANGQRVHDARGVVDERRHLRAILAARPHAEVHKIGSIDAPLVILPDGHHLVDPVPGDARAVVQLPEAILLAVDAPEGRLHLLCTATLEDVVGAGRLQRLHHGEEGLRPALEELRHLLPFRGVQLLHCPHPRRSHRLAHEILVAPGARVLLAVAPQLQREGELVRQAHAGLGAGQDGFQRPGQRLELGDGVLQGLLLVGGEVVVLDGGVEAAGDALLHKIRHGRVVLAEDPDDMKAPLLDCGGQKRASAERIHHGDHALLSGLPRVLGH